MSPTVLNLLNDFRLLDLSDIREALKYYEVVKGLHFQYVENFINRAKDIHDKKALKNEDAKRTSSKK